jgi:hypothetical protein
MPGPAVTSNTMKLINLYYVQSASAFRQVWASIVAHLLQSSDDNMAVSLLNERLKAVELPKIFATIQHAKRDVGSSTANK